eukprot:2169883-Prymnesium_polylepis.1
MREAAQAAEREGLRYHASGDVGSALRSFTNAHELSPHPQYALKAANLRLRLGDVEGAATLYREVLEPVSYTHLTLPTICSV